MKSKNGNPFSLKYAIQGIKTAFKEERNFKIQIFLMLLAIGAGIFFKLSKIEFAILSITISFVIFGELVNTAIESTIDMFTSDYHPLAEKAKDVAAGAVLIVSVNSIIVGYFLFFDKIIKFFK